LSRGGGKRHVKSHAKKKKNLRISVPKSKKTINEGKTAKTFQGNKNIKRVRPGSKKGKRFLYETKVLLRVPEDEYHRGDELDHHLERGKDAANTWKWGWPEP